MTPNYENAAIKAMETLIIYGISATPVDPLPILKRIPGTLLISYEHMSNSIGMDRQCVISMFGEKNQDAFTSVNIVNGKKHYLVTYNQKLSFNLLQKALARELGHIILGHDGTKPEEIRNEEAKCFAHHLLCPRPLIRAIQEANIPLTTDALANITGIYDTCLSCMRKTPAIYVPIEFNRLVRDQFKDYIENLLNYLRAQSDESPLADLGTFMDGYTEV